MRIADVWWLRDADSESGSGSESEWIPVTEIIPEESKLIFSIAVRKVGFCPGRHGGEFTTRPYLKLYLSEALLAELFPEGDLS